MIQNALKAGTSAIALVFFFFVLTASPLSAEEHEPAKAGQFDLNKILVHHLMDAPIIEFNLNLCFLPPTVGPWKTCGTKIREGHPAFKDPQYVRRYSFVDAQGEYKWDGGLPLHITKRVAMMFIVSGVLMLVMISAARMISKNPFKISNRFASMIESLVQYMRTEVVDSNMHHERGFLPYILTLFFFILFSNIMGLFPPFGEYAHMIANVAAGHAYNHEEHGPLVSKIMLIWPGITVTGDIAVTMTLAVVTTALIWITGFRFQGFKFLLSCMPPGMPWYLYWLFLILFPLELIIGPLAKGFALMIRLLSNMTAGHVIIIALLGFIFQFAKFWFFVPIISVAGAGAIFMLEVLVAFLQAYIFALLTALFVGSSMASH